MTFKSAIFDKRVRISSWMPSAKYALALSSLRFSNGSTAILFSGIETATLPSADTCLMLGDSRRRKIETVIANATAETSEAAVSRNFGDQGGLTGRGEAAFCFHLRRLSLSGICELPRPFLQRLNKCRRSPCFTSHSPRSCKYGCQCRY